ncbi:DUF5696 domain-containing protein [Paenibacillus soyae]|uniref:DUF5696 domain-containing protein n=1 Tax=Paenibacillus soyae TaxID=2969249 RepID=A0A9X2MMY9_9BACL|nr:DUF5696 domain-containing protein [Paenibacillus soyae]MCR2803651.1 DUF5696 domain-containing protein [Paenibacillus soyae]
MKTKTKRYVALACVLAASVAGLLIYSQNKGVPAIRVDAYAEASAGKIERVDLKLGAGDELVPDMRLAAETDELALYYHPETAEFAVLNKNSGKVWRSNPADREEDAVASAFEKEVLASQLTLTFRDEAGRMNTVSSYADSVSKGQFQAEGIEGGFLLTYTMGDMSLGIDALPKLISKQRMEEKVLAQLDEDQAKYVSTRYYPLDGNPDVLERLDTAVSRELVLKRMLEAFQQAGYTAEDLAFDNEENGIGSGGAADRPSFTVPIHIRLDGDSLVATIPTGEIEESAGYNIRMLNMLGFFGAAGTKEEGYILVPDGTGSLIHLNNGKTNQEVYAQRLYGEDENDNSGRRGQVAESARLPVFGMKAGDEAWYAVIEQGDGIATVQADISGRNNSYNQVFAAFAIRGEDELELYKGNQVEEIQLLTEERYTGDVQVRYRFLSGDDADYSGMARSYRAHLEQQSVLKPLEEQASIPFFVSVLGAVDKRKSFLGVPYQGLVPMTTFEQAGSMAERLGADGITAVQMRYLGWFNDGMNHDIPAKVDVEGALGGLDALRGLSGKLEAMGGKLYPDVAFQHVFRDQGRFAPASDAARYVTREEATRTPYNRAFNSMDTDLGIYYLLSPAKLPYYVDRFLDGYRKTELDSVSLRDLGDKLHADYRVNRVVFRETAKAIVEEQLAEIKSRYPNVMVSGGNAYTLAYADRIINVPSSSSGFNITDESVPFYQMVLHGYADYAGSPLNLDNEQDLNLQLLRAVELGSAPHFLWSAESSSRLKFTAYDTMYSTNYEDWYDLAVDLYEKANEALSPLRHVKMDRHIRHGEDVVEMRYENGDSIFVNYSSQPVTIDGVRIEAMNFAKGGDGG